MTRPVAERKAEVKAEAETGDRTGDKKGNRTPLTVSRVRTRLAQLIWLVAVVCALFLAVGALCVALDANRDNALVEVRSAVKE